MSDCNQMNCRGAYGMGRRMSAMPQGRFAAPPRSSAYMRAANNGAAYSQENDLLSDLPLAMGYVPRQIWQDIYEPEKALMRGTIFAQLDKPFCGVRGGRRA